MRRTFDREGLGYVMRVPELTIEMAIDHLSRGRDGLSGELAVDCALPGTRSTDGHLHSARFNVSRGTDRSTVARKLKQRMGDQVTVDWDDLLEDFCRRVMAAERQGSPIEKVGALALVSSEESYRLAPLLPLDQVTILYGDGGTGKSTLAAAFAVSVQAGVALLDGWVPRKSPVLYLDWEAGRDSVNRRVKGVAMGARLPRDIQVDYLDMRRRGPLYQHAEDVARMVAQGGHGLVIVDSIGMASGTAGEQTDANESAIRLFTALGYLGSTIVGIDHVNRTDAEATNKRSRPYGSVYKSNLARATFELRRQKTADGSSALLLVNTKVNDADDLAPQALRVIHGEDGSIAYERMEAVPTELAGSLTQADQLAAWLVDDHFSVEQLSEFTGLPENTVRAVLSRHKQRFNRLGSGKWELIP